MPDELTFEHSKLLIEFRLLYCAWLLANKGNYPWLMEPIVAQTDHWRNSSFLPGSPKPWNNDLTRPYFWKENWAPLLPEYGLGMYTNIYWTHWGSLCHVCASEDPFAIEHVEHGDLDHEIICDGCGTMLVEAYDPDLEDAV